tara:strand:- start:414 stop:551 length:138 start_codon:yes stop_codon:yes gene_type:complete
MDVHELVSYAPTSSAWHIENDGFMGKRKNNAGGTTEDEVALKHQV